MFFFFFGKIWISGTMNEIIFPRCFFFFFRCPAHPPSKFEISKRMSRTWCSPSRSTLRNCISKGSIRSTRGCFCSSWRGRGTSLEPLVNKSFSFSFSRPLDLTLFLFLLFPDEYFNFLSRLRFGRRFTGAQSVQRQWYLPQLWKNESEDQDWQSALASQQFVRRWHCSL